MNNNNHNSNKKRRYKNNMSKEEALSRALSKVLRHEAVNLGLAISSDGYVSVQDILSLGSTPPNKTKSTSKSKSKSKSKGADENAGRGRQRQNTSQAMSGRFSNYTIEDVKQVVANNEKKRFRLEMRIHPSILKEDNNSRGSTQQNTENKNQKLVLCIRANQGHSMTCVNEKELLVPISSEELANIEENGIVHGTYRKAWTEHIQEEGLCRMTRNHIHFAPGLPSGFLSESPKDSVKVISGMRTSCDILVFIDGEKCAKDYIPFFRSDNGVILTPGLGERGMLPVSYFWKVIDVKSKKAIPISSITNKG